MYHPPATDSLEGRSHILVTKEEERDSVAVEVRLLNHAERVREIARMLSGSVTETSLRHAEELLQGSKGVSNKR